MQKRLPGLNQRRRMRRGRKKSIKNGNRDHTANGVELLSKRIFYGVAIKSDIHKMLPLLSNFFATEIRFRNIKFVEMLCIKNSYRG